MDLEPFAAAGLYDAGAPHAEERRELIEFLVEQGCSIEEMVAADARGRLFALAGDRIVRPDRDRFTLAQVAGQVGVPLEQVRALWRAWGLVEADPDVPVASPADVEIVRDVLATVEVFGLEPILGLGRVLGSALARVADATSTMVRTRMPDMALSLSGSEVTTARTFAAVAAGTPGLGRALDVLFRHHLEAARMHFERAEGWDSDDGGIRIAVGFADLCGFTGLTQRLTMDELSQLLGRFEEIATGVVADHDGRLIKFIGDAVMFISHDAVSAVAIADELVTAAETRGLAARAGVAAGSALALDGDYFGPVVNLAARLVALAEPGDVLATSEVVERLGDRREATPLGPRQLRGFDEPVPVSRLLRYLPAHADQP